MTPEAIKTFCKGLAVVAVAVGGFGSVAVIPMALSNNAYFVLITGVYFVAGGIMIVGGLLSYSVLIKTE